MRSFLLDEVQSGFGEAESFLHTNFIILSQISFAWLKGMGNGFPIGGILIAPHFEAFGLLGTTLAVVIWLVPQVSPY
jgi:acetylornithine aminotransferase